MNRYESLATDIESAITSGVLQPGDRLPSVRHTSHSRKVSLSTVFRAYYLLESRGLIHARERSGYYVAPKKPAALPRVHAVSAPTQKSSFVNISDAVFAMLEFGTRPDFIPLGSPFPDATLFPLADLGRSMAASMRDYTAPNTVEDLSPGKLALRRLIAQRYVARGVNIHHDEIVVTNGALEALNLCLSTVARAGDTIVVESPAFYGALQAIERLGMRAAEVATHPEHGIDLDRLESALRQHKPKACWLMPTFHNPLGASMPDDNKRALVRLLTAHGVPLIEDDVYAELHFGESSPRPAKAWDTEGIVLHCSSFSKSLAPGYRIGWVAPGRYFQQVARQKLTTTLMSSMPAQLGLVAYLQRPGFDRHLKKLRATLASRHDEVAHAICRFFPQGSHATSPEGGYFMWVQMPENVDAMELLNRVKRRNICIAPGPVFSASESFRNCVRVNFSFGASGRIEGAIRYLGGAACQLAGRDPS